MGEGVKSRLLAQYVVQIGRSNPPLRQFIGANAIIPGLQQTGQRKKGANQQAAAGGQEMRYRRPVNDGKAWGYGQRPVEHRWDCSIRAVILTYPPSFPIPYRPSRPPTVLPA